MPLRLEIKKKLQTHTERVKSVCFHPTLPWCLSALYNGYLLIHNWEEQTTVRTIEVCPSTVIRCAKFIPRKEWVICGADDMIVRVFNYNSMEKVRQFDAHSDFIRHIAVHPTLSLVLTSSDDLTVKLWDWSRDWIRVATFEGHVHYVMMAQWNPKDSHIFGTASLDRTVKVWGIQAPRATSSSASGQVVSQPFFTLSGHEAGVNCLDYATNREKPYIVSGSDDHTLRVWDYQTKQCMTVLTGHSKPVFCVTFHHYLPIILSGAEDGVFNLWHSTTYRLESPLKYSMGRLWSVATDVSSNSVALGTDEGTLVIRMGSERAVASMHGNKIVVAKGSELQLVNLRLLDESLYSDGEKLPFMAKDMGACEVFPQSLSHHPNGRMIAVCGDGEFVVYTSQALRSKAYGKAVDFVWSSEGHFAVRDETGRIGVFHNFKEHVDFKPAFIVEEMFGGRLLGLKGVDFVCFYDWQEFRLIRRIDIKANYIFWSDAGDRVVLASNDSFFVLKHDLEAVAIAMGGDVADIDDGIEIAFELEREVNEKIESGLWIADCFIFTTSRLRLQSIQAGVTDTIAFLDRPVWLLGYLHETSRVYLIDRELALISYKVNDVLIEYQTAIAQKDFENAAKILNNVPSSLHNKAARFLEAQGHKEKALEVTKDLDHKYELSKALGKLELCAKVIREAQAAARDGDQVYREQWKKLGDLGLERGSLSLAIACFQEARDLSGLLLIYSSIGDAEGMRQVADKAAQDGLTQIAFLAYLLLQDVDQCIEVLLDANRVPEAALFAKNYAPSRVPELVKLWKQKLEQAGFTAVAQVLADPETNSDLFPHWNEAKQAEAQFRKKRIQTLQLSSVSLIGSDTDRMTDKLADIAQQEETVEEDELD